MEVISFFLLVLPSTVSAFALQLEGWFEAFLKRFYVICELPFLNFDIRHAVVIIVESFFSLRKTSKGFLHSPLILNAINSAGLDYWLLCCQKPVFWWSLLMTDQSVVYIALTTFTVDRIDISLLLSGILRQNIFSKVLSIMKYRST